MFQDDRSWKKIQNGYTDARKIYVFLRESRADISTKGSIPPESYYKYVSMYII